MERLHNRDAEWCLSSPETESLFEILRVYSYFIWFFIRSIPERCILSIDQASFGIIVILNISRIVKLISELIEWSHVAADLGVRIDVDLLENISMVKRKFKFFWETASDIDVGKLGGREK